MDTVTIKPMSTDAQIKELHDKLNSILAAISHNTNKVQHNTNTHVQIHNINTENKKTNNVLLLMLAFLFFLGFVDGIMGGTIEDLPTHSYDENGDRIIGRSYVLGFMLVVVFSPYAVGFAFGIVIRNILEQS